MPRSNRLATAPRSGLLPLCALAAFAVGLVACEEDGLVVQQAVLDATPLSIDFGEVDLSQQRVETVFVRNSEIVPEALADLSIEDDCGGCFAVVTSVSEVRGYETVELQVRFRPTAVGPAAGTFRIVGETQPTALEVSLAGIGVDGRRPDLVVSPAAVDFGFVPAGGDAVRSFTIRSVGQSLLVIDRVRIDPADGPFVITTSTPTPANPGELAPGETASVGLRVSLPMAETGTRTADIYIETNVLEEKNVAGQPGVVRLPLSALGNLPPVAVVAEVESIEPYSELKLDGTMSYDQDMPQNLPLQYQWTLVSTPAGAQPELVRPSTAEPVFRADETGDYELELVVIDALGLESAPAKVTVSVLPEAAVRIELTWDHPDSDLDLHLIQQGGTFCDCATSVNYRDCAREPNWFPATPGANPKLERDDRDGFGPEYIDMEGEGPTKLIPDGRYTIAVHYFSNAEQVSTWPTTTSNATLRVYIRGVLRAEVTRAMVTERELWYVGDLVWPDRELVLDGTVLGDQVCGVL